MEKPDWEGEAKKAVKLVGERMMEAHRGAFVWHKPTDTMLIFANDGFAKYHREFLTESCVKADWHIRASAATDDDYSFAMLVCCDDEEGAADLVWESWQKVCEAPIPPEYINLQRQIAQDRIGRLLTGLERPFEMEGDQQ